MTVYVEPGAALNLTAQPKGVADVLASATFGICGSFTAGANSGFAFLTSIDGSVRTGNGQTIDIIIGTLTIPRDGVLTVSNNANVEVLGNASNSWDIGC